MNGLAAKANYDSTVSASPPPDFMGVSVSKIRNGYVVYASGYHAGKSISEQIYAPDGDEVGDIVSLVLESPQSLL